MAYLSVPYAILPSIQQTNADHYDSNTTSIHRSILSVFKNKRYEWNNIFKNLAGAWCVGSSHGWLVVLDTNATPLLLNPSSDTCIHLPPFPPSFMHPVTQSYFAEHLRKTFIVKAVLMHAASPKNYMLAIIYGPHCKLAFCKYSSTWVELSDAKRCYYDIVFKNNFLCALAKDGSVEGWDVCQQVPRKILYVKPTLEIGEEEKKEFPTHLFSTQLYLVISEGEILLVRRYIGDFVNEDGIAVDEGYLLSSEDAHPLICPYRTKHFSVYKLDFKKIKWEKMTSLQDRILFLGANESISIPVQALPRCEANSIYFSDDKWDEMSLDYLYGGHDWGVFNLQDGSIKLLTPCQDKMDPPPIWVVPTPKSFDDLSISS